VKLTQRLAKVFAKAADYLSPPYDRGSWFTVYDSRAGSFQQASPITTESVLAFHAVYACITLISNDIGKLRVKLVERSTGNIWQETESASFSPVLRKPNHYQNHIQFKEWWILSKLTWGNAYALKVRDGRGLVTSLYLLDPNRCWPLVAPTGEVFYRIDSDNLSGVEEQVVVPASEIIHDRMNCLFHPLVGLSPIFACGLAAQQGLAIQNNSSKFFENMSRPSGILTAPGAISKETAERLKTQWEANYGGDNIGKVAVLGDALKYEALSVNPVDAQIVEQLKMTAEVVCSTFHVPPFKVGVGQMPTYQNAEILNQIYYSDCLQSLIEQMELCLDEGLGLASPKDGRLMGVELDLDQLLRMDSATMVKTLGEGVNRAIYSPNEARQRLDLPPVEGGASPLMQQQNYSLSALAKRDAGEDPFGKAAAPAPAPAAAEPEEGDEEEDQERAFETKLAPLAARLAALERAASAPTWFEDFVRKVEEPYPA
jgi:HK97 family phage portal protein